MMPTALTKARITFSFSKLQTSSSIQEAKAIKPSMDFHLQLRSSKMANKLRALNGLGSVLSALESQKVRTSFFF